MTSLAPASPGRPTLPGTSGAGATARRPGTRTTRDNTERVALIACGALGATANVIAERTAWPVDVHPLPPLLHNRPHLIAGEVERLATDLLPRYGRVAVGYADCGTNGAVDEVCERLGMDRLTGVTCFDLYAGAERYEAMLQKAPGTFFLTDYLALSFGRSVIAELGLDRYPELRDDYFGHYTRMVWLAQAPDDERVAAAARDASEAIGLPLEVVPAGDVGLLAEMGRLVSGAGPRGVGTGLPDL